MSALLTAWDRLAAEATSAAPSFVLWKAGYDLDALAAERDWPALAAVVEGWAAAEGATAVVRCTHVPGRLVLVGVAGEDLLQVDLIAHRPAGIGSWFDADSVAGAAGVDEHGVRRLSPDEEALLDALAGGSTVTPGAAARALAARLPRPSALVLGAARGSAAARLLGAAWPTTARSWRRYQPCAVTDALAQERRAGPGWLDAVRATHEVRDL